jgi:hypothetical protein
MRKPRSTQTLNPGADLNAAYKNAAPGDEFILTPGDYGAQTIKRTGNHPAGSTPVVFRGQPGVKLGKITLYGDAIELADLQAQGVFIKGPDNRYPPGTQPLDTDYVVGVTIRNVFLDGLGHTAFSAHRAKDLQVIGGEWTSSLPVDGDNQMTSIVDVLVDGVHIHDWIDVGPGQQHHIEGLQFGGADGLTVRNCIFERNGTHDLFMRSWGTTYDGDPQPLRRIVIEGNAFRALKSGGYYVMQMVDDLVLDADKPTDAIVRGNSFEMTAIFDFEHGGIEFYGNRYPGWSAYNADSAKPELTAHDNVNKGGTIEWPGDTIDPNVDLANPPASTPIPPDPTDPCAECEAELAETQAELAAANAELSTLTAQLSYTEADLTAAEAKIAEAVEVLTT